MTRKSALVSFVAALFFIAILGALVPFVGYLSPSAKAYADLPRVPIPDLKPASYAYVTHPRTTNWQTSDILIVKRKNGDLDFWYVPTKNGKRTLPDYRWWRAGWPCDDLSPDFETNRIYCKDPNISDFMAEFVWSFDGKDLSQHDWIPDLARVQGKVILGDFVLFHPDAS